MSKQFGVKKRGGRPNRGGRRFNKPRGGHHSSPRGGSHGNSRGRGSHGNSRGSGSGGMGSRKGGTRLFDDGDDFALLEHAIPQLDTSDYMATQRPKPKHSVTKVAMQTVYMTEENQAMVEEMLREIHDSDSDEGELCGEEYDELDHRDVSQYWTTSSNLIVQGAQSSAAPFLEELSALPIASHVQDATEVALNTYAVRKLMRYGFSKDRCEESLRKCNGDVGSSLEHLLCECCGIEQASSEPECGDEDGENNGDDFTEAELEWEEIKEQRREEMMALTSIYGDAFKEIIPNTVWSISLELAYVTDFTKQLKNRDSKAIMQQAASKDNAKLCKFFVKGNCKFGAKCRNPHSIPEQVSNRDDLTLSVHYCIDIRFPKGNRYPKQIPLIFFSTTNQLFPVGNILHVTSKLIEEARTLVDDSMPVVFSLVSLLENEDEILPLLKLPAHEFNIAKPVFVNVNRTVRTDEGVQKTQPKEADKGQEAISDDFVGDDSENEKGGYTRLESSYRLKGHPSAKSRYAPCFDDKSFLKENKKIIDKFHKLQSSKQYVEMLMTRRKLPAWKLMDEVTSKLRENQVIVVSGMTGCGKTTQVPQFILDSHIIQNNPRFLCNIVCTQPRRLSAMAVAERVSEERLEKLGQTVGYQIRLESVMSEATRLLFCTTGILLRRLESDGTLQGVTHVIIDEVHERTEESDFLMMVLRDLLPRRRDLKLILMSATLNADLFSSYFKRCPVIDIPGKAFPVDQYFLEDVLELSKYALEENSPYARPLKRANSSRVEDVEDELASLSVCNRGDKYPRDNIQDQNLTVKELFMRYSDYRKSAIKTLALMDHEKINYDLIEAILDWIICGEHEYPKDGAVLIFLPGMAEIQQMYEQLISSRTFGGRANKDRFKIIPLHSTLSSEEQHTVFNRPAKGVTKIVIATNIAETSITIDDIVFVIDSGRMKEKRYDPTKNMESLDTVWVSRANAVQRKGRAGRVTSGVSFHLFTGHRYEHHMRDQPIPEIQRAPLEQLILKIKLLDLFKNMNLRVVMNKLIESPSDEMISSAIKRLEDLGALHVDEELTALGYHLASLPVDVRIGKLMIFGAIFRCLDSVLTIAAALSYKSPFVSPFDKRDEADKKKLEFATSSSDHLTMLKAYKEWILASKNGSHAGYLYCMENYLSLKTLQMLASMKRQFVELLSDIGFAPESLTSKALERRAKGGADGVTLVTGPEANSNSDNMKLVSAILVAALYPNIVQIMTPETTFTKSSAGAIPKAPKPEELKFKTHSDGYVHIHPSSVNFQVRHYESPYLVYHEKVKTSKVFIRDCSMVSIYPLVLFSGESVSIDLHRGDFIVSIDDGWIKIKAASHQVARLLQELRAELDQLLVDKIENPDVDLYTCSRRGRVIETIVHLITSQ